MEKKRELNVGHLIMLPDKELMELAFNCRLLIAYLALIEKFIKELLKIVFIIF